MFADEPGLVKALAAGAGMQAPFSLRALMNRIGSRTKVVRVALLRYVWAAPARSTVPPPAQWNDSQVSEILLLGEWLERRAVLVAVFNWAVRIFGGPIASENISV